MGLTLAWASVAGATDCDHQVFALDSKTTDEEIEEVALRHGVDISFVKDTPEARGRKKHSEARVDVELLEEVEAYKSLHRFRSVIPTRGLADSLGVPRARESELMVAKG